MPETRLSLLDRVERAGNRLPDPTTLFVLGTFLVMALSHLAFRVQWQVELVQPQLTETGQIDWSPSGETLQSRSLLSRDGIDWAIRSLVRNFMAFPPLGVVLVGMLGIGVAERTGLIAALLRGGMALVPPQLLTPCMVFLGIMSSMTLDAGYVILPPLAAALYHAAGRSPIAGLAAVFAGVSAGFNANLFITGLDPMLAAFTATGARVVDELYAINPACNWFFMIASTVVMTLTGWAVTSWLVEKRLSRKPASEGGPDLVRQEEANQSLSAGERRGLGVAGLTLGAVMVVVAMLILIPGAPLYTYSMEVEGRTILAEMTEEGLVPSERPFARWVDAIVPLLFFVFIVPALAFGISVGTVRSDRDLARLMGESMAAMAPIIVLAFVAAQFIEHFRYSQLDRMLAMSGGQWLGQMGWAPWILILAFILLTAVFNLFVGSMSAKYALFAPVFVPMFMMVGISPELTQVAYRIGDSVTNIITPLNAYLVIILVFLKKYVPRGGMGTLVATMLPYSVIFLLVWTVLLLAWMALGWPLGPDGPLQYLPTTPRLP